MPTLPKRSFLGLLVFAVVVIAITGFAGEAAAQVFQGPFAMTSPTAVTFTMTVTLHPGGPATYTMATLQGRVFDRGFLAASVNGSSVNGYFQTTTFPNTRPCVFSGTVNGPVAILNADPTSCGLVGTVTLTRIS